MAFQRDGRSPECLEDILVEGEKSEMFLKTGRYIAWLSSLKTAGAVCPGYQSLKVQLVGSSSSQFTVPSLAEDLAMKMLTQVRDTEPFISTDGSKFLLKEGLVANNEDQSQIFEFLKMRKMVEVRSANNVEFVKVPLMRDSKVVVENGFQNMTAILSSSLHSSQMLSISSVIIVTELIWINSLFICMHIVVKYFDLLFDQNIFAKQFPLSLSGIRKGN